MVRSAEAGASLAQIAAISGHSIEQTQKNLEHHIARNRLWPSRRWTFSWRTPGQSGIVSCCRVARTREGNPCPLQADEKTGPQAPLHNRLQKTGDPLS
jgi:hypothetical protein